MPLPFYALTRRLVLPLSLAISTPSFGETKPASPSDASDPIQISTLFRAPDLSRVRLSPDGLSIAGLNYSPNGHTNLALLTLGQPDATILKGSERTNPHSFVWLNSNSLLVQSIRNNIYAGGLYAVHRDDFGKMIPLTYGNVEIVGRPRARPKNVILWQDLRDYEYLNNEVQLMELSLDDYRHNRVTASQDRFRTKYPEPKEDVVLDYASDVAGELALCYVYRDGKLRALIFDATNNKWAPLSFEAETTTVLAVEADHRHLWISEFAENAGFQVCRFSVATGERAPPVITDHLVRSRPKCRSFFT